MKLFRKIIPKRVLCSECDNMRIATKGPPIYVCCELVCFVNPNTPHRCRHFTELTTTAAERGTTRKDLL